VFSSVEEAEEVVSDPEQAASESNKEKEAT
jgi:hypothetical protein